MHRALTVDEILQRCFVNLPHQDLYFLALAAKAFLEPALNELWRDLHGLTELLSLLPEDLFRFDRTYRDVPSSPPQRVMTSETFVSTCSIFNVSATRQLLHKYIYSLLSFRHSLALQLRTTGSAFAVMHVGFESSQTPIHRPCVSQRLP